MTGASNSLAGRARRSVLRLLPILASVVLYSLAFPPFNMGFLVFIALVPWLYSLALLDGSRPNGFRSGYLFGFLIVLGQMYFVQSLAAKWTGSIALSSIPWLLSAIIGAFYFAILGWLFTKALARGWWWVIPITFAGMEVIRSFMPGLAFPYFLLATPLWPFPALIQGAFVGTIYLVSAWVCLINVIATMLLFRARMQAVRPYAFVAGLMLLASLVRYVQPFDGDPKRIACGQPGVDIAFGNPVERERRIMANVASLYKTAKTFQADILILPEGIADAGSVMPPKTPFHVDPAQPVLFGARRRIPGDPMEGADRQQWKTYQSAIAFDHGRWQFTDKERLVVFGEYVPGRAYFPFLARFKFPAGDMSPGEKTNALLVNGIRVGPMLCFEGLFWDSAFKQVENGAQLLAIMSIDDWYMGTPAPDQLKTGAIWRAVECALPVVRVASCGYTLAVDQRGRVTKDISVGLPGCLLAIVVLPKAPTRLPIRQLFPWSFSLSVPLAGFLMIVTRKAPPRSGVAHGLSDHDRSSMPS